MTSRQLFPPVYIPLVYVGLGHALWALRSGGDALLWMGVLIACIPPVFLFTSMVSYRVARTARTLPLVFTGGLAGGMASLAGAFAASQAGSEIAVAPLVYAVGAGLIGAPLYVYWYSVLPTSGGGLAVGEPLPDFTLTGVDGAPVESGSLRGRPAILMFHRGNWCPLCMAQIGEVARRYQEISSRGAVMWLISGQSQKETERLARIRDVGFVHLRDEGLRVARQLGLYHPGATPMGVGALGFDDDAYLPTVVVIDAGGVVRWAQTTDNYRVRPEPETFLAVLDELG